MMGNKHFSLMHIGLFVLLVLSLAACRQSQQTPPQDDAAVTIELQVSPEPPITGETTLLIHVTDKEGKPITNAQIDVRGDMTHAGMQPVSAIAVAGPEGDYKVPFQWTMSGDWIVTINVVLPDGTAYKKTFDLTVANS